MKTIQWGGESGSAKILLAKRYSSLAPAQNYTNDRLSAEDERTKSSPQKRRLYFCIRLLMISPYIVALWKCKQEQNVEFVFFFFKKKAYFPGKTCCTWPVWDCVKGQLMGGAGQKCLQVPTAQPSWTFNSPSEGSV